MFDAYKKGHITKSKFARIMGGIYGHQGDYYDENDVGVRRMRGRLETIWNSSQYKSWNNISLG